MQTVMKAQLKYFLPAVILITLLSFVVNVSVKPKGEVVTIQTSAICESCKKRIEKELKNTDGVLEANLNLGNKKIKVKYDPAKISADQVRTAISNTGYDADYVKRNEEAFKKLPHCCQQPEQGGMHN
jgi:copper chaperone CopZ